MSLITLDTETPRNMLYGDLLLAVMPEREELAERPVRMEAEAGLKELLRRRKQLPDIIDTVVRKAITHSDIHELKQKHHATTYLDFMRAVAGTIPNALIDNWVPNIVNARTDEPEKERRKRIALAQAAGKRGFALTRRKRVPSDLQGVATNAKRHPIDEEIYLREEKVKQNSSILYIAAKQWKTWRSSIEKLARIVAARSDPKRQMISRRMLESITIFDSAGLEYGVMREAHAYQLVDRLRSSPLLSLAEDLGSERIQKDYAKRELSDREYRGVHRPFYIDGWLARLHPTPDPLDFHLLAADGVLLNFFDPKTSHSMHDMRKIDRQHQRRYDEREGRWKAVRGKRLTKQQKRLYHTLYNDLLEESIGMLVDLGEPYSSLLT